jgi:predicted site-specific integrase-resolvase
MSRLVSAKELAPLLGVDDKTVLKWARNGILPRIVFSKRCVKFDPDECKKAIEKRTSYRIA